MLFGMKELAELNLFTLSRNKQAMAKKKKSALKGNWKWIDEELPPEGKNVLVTNNPEAKTAQGHMSHIWISCVYKSDDKNDGKYVGFTDFHKLFNLVAWHELPEPP